MRVALLALLALLVTPAAMAVQYRGTTLSPEGGVTLVLHTDHGDVRAPRTAKNQYGFAGPHISPDGRMVGWLELVPVQGIDGPIPGALVIFRNGRVVRSFYCGGPVIDDWTFAKGGGAIACATSTLHFMSSYEYQLLRISDGRLLAEFSCGRSLVGPTPQSEHWGAWVNEGKVPAWVWPVAQECPTR